MFLRLACAHISDKVEREVRSKMEDVGCAQRPSYTTTEDFPLIIQVKCKANAEPRLVRAMLSRSLHSPMHLKCIGKGTTSENRYYDYSSLQHIIR